MEIRGTFSELILQSMDINERTDAEPMQLFVEDVPLVTGRTPSIICNEASDPFNRSVPYERYRYVLMLHRVKEVLRKWCDGTTQEMTPDEACRAVMHYSEHDSYIPAGSITPGYTFVWRVGHKRGDA